MKLFPGVPVIGPPHQQGLSKAGLFRTLHQHFTKAASLQFCWFLNHCLWVLLSLALNHGVVVLCD